MMPPPPPPRRNAKPAVVGSGDSYSLSRNLLSLTRVLRGETTWGSDRSISSSYWERVLVLGSKPACLINELWGEAGHGWSREVRPCAPDTKKSSWHQAKEQEQAQGRTSRCKWAHNLVFFLFLVFIINWENRLCSSERFRFTLIELKHGAALIR